MLRLMNLKHVASMMRKIYEDDRVEFDHTDE